jgi:hypothetical protein
VDEVGAVGVVGEDAADPGRREEHVLRPLALEERAHGGAVQKVELRARLQQQLALAGGLEGPHQRRADHAAVAGDEDACVRRQVRLTHAAARS